MGLNKRKIFRWLKVLIIIYCGIGIGMYSLQETILFHPKKLHTDYVFKIDQPYTETRIPFNKEDTMSLVKFLTVDSNAKGVIIYFHGNLKNIERFAPFVKSFTKQGYEVWMPDYPGYGKSTGSITEEKLYDQAVQVREMASVKFDSSRIILYGKSMGSGIAAYVASITPNKLLILETPYYSIPDIFDAYTYIYPVNKMIKYKMPTYQYLEETQERVVIFAGRTDWIIPYRCAVKLKPALKPGDKFITVDKAGHNEVNISPEYLAVIDSLLKY